MRKEAELKSRRWRDGGDCSNGNRALSPIVCPKRFELDYLQGDEVEGYEGTCSLTSVANLLTQSGKPTTEGDVVRRDRLKSRRWWDGRE